jgi:hypothetical protein
LKAREKISGYSSEISTLRSRLKGAVDRAEKAETALEENLAQNSDSYDRMERGAAPASGNGMRRRGQRGGSGGTSISSAMHLNKSERVGKAVDALDSFTVSTGKSSVFLVSNLSSVLTSPFSFNRKIPSLQSYCTRYVHHVFTSPSSLDLRGNLLSCAQLRGHASRRFASRSRCYCTKSVGCGWSSSGGCSQGSRCKCEGKADIN